MPTSQEKKPALKAMTNEEILKKAIEKAVQNGYTPQGMYAQTQAYQPQTGEYEVVPTVISSNDIIFSHDFAKAFWGNEWVDEYGNTFKEHQKEIKKGMHYPIDYEWYNKDFAWGYRLKSMILSEDPLQYLAKFL